MNGKTLEQILETFEKFRQDILTEKYDIRMILNGILTFLIETLRFEIDKNKEVSIYK